MSKCLALFSGGLDSMIALKLMTLQNIEVLALYFDIGFGSKGDKSEILASRAHQCGAEFKVIDIRDEYLQNVLFSPKFGYGKHFNPCIDCHGYMAKSAILMMQREGADFIITGEVLGQRPMSQRSAALNQVKKLANDLDSVILRPLSAKLLPPTKPEIMGIVDREKLLDISGRGRTRQMELAKEFKFSDYETPAGGCLLTIDSFANKIKDMIAHEKIESESDVEILKFGRHLRLPNGAKMVIGRDESENNALGEIKNSKFEQIWIENVVGAHSYISKNAEISDLTLACSLALAYTKAKPGEKYFVRVGEFRAEFTNETDKKEAQKYFIV